MGKPRSAFDRRQIESAETPWIGQDVHLDDLAAGDGEADHGKQAAVGTARHKPKMAVDEDKLIEEADPRELGLHDAARTVQVRDGQTHVRSGTYLAERAAGYAVYEADGIEAAIALAARIPAARLGGAVEIRPAEKYW
jgi:hypothetical protein